MIRNKLLRSERGATALEFAFAAPILFTFVVGVGQLGTIFYANTGLQHALSEGARVAAVFPTPLHPEITAAVVNRKFGYDPANLENVPLITEGTDENGYRYIDLRLRYKVPLTLIAYQLPITLDQTRRVYLQEAPAATTNPSTSSSTSSTTSGGTTTSSTSSTSSASSTSSTSSGSTTTSGGTTTTSGGTTTTSGGTTTTSGGTTTTSSGNGNGNNGSSGNGNGNGSSGNAHSSSGNNKK